MSLNIRLFVLLGVFGVFVQQPAIGQSVTPAASPRGGVSEQMEQGLVRPDSGELSPIDNILGSGIRLPPQFGDTQPTPSAVPTDTPAAVPEKVAPVTGDAYAK